MRLACCCRYLVWWESTLSMTSCCFVRSLSCGFFLLRVILSVPLSRTARCLFSSSGWKKAISEFAIAFESWVQCFSEVWVVHCVSLKCCIRWLSICWCISCVSLFLSLLVLCGCWVSCSCLIRCSRVFLNIVSKLGVWCK